MTTSQLINDKQLKLIYLENIRSSDTKRTLWSIMAQQGLAASEFGSGENALSKLNSDSIAKITSALSIGLPDIYKDKKKKATLTLNVCIISISLAFLLLLVGISVAFRNSSSQQLGLITSATSLIPTFLSGTFFFVYKRADKNLQLIESDITKIKVLESFSSIASNLPNPDLATEAFKKIISQMER